MYSTLLSVHTVYQYLYMYQSHLNYCLWLHPVKCTQRTENRKTRTLKCAQRVKSKNVHNAMKIKMYTTK